MAWDRRERLEALLREKIAIIVLERLNDPRLGFVTITGVQLSKDKRHAKVLYTVLGTAGQRRTTDRALQDAARHVQEQLAPTLRLRVMPELRFTYDESIEKESRMLGLLDELASSRRGAQPAGSDTLADADSRPAGTSDDKDTGADDETTDGTTHVSVNEIGDESGGKHAEKDSADAPPGDDDPQGVDADARGRTQ